MTEHEVEARVGDLHGELEATRELPVDRVAARWIGEAEAVAADLVHADVTEPVLRERLAVIRDLLGNVDDTGHPDADGHVADARRIAGELLEQLGGG